MMCVKVVQVQVLVAVSGPMLGPVSLSVRSCRVGSGVGVNVYIHVYVQVLKLVRLKSKAKFTHEYECF
jgi:hypothetical protein